jgi:hypothetical protein
LVLTWGFEVFFDQLFPSFGKFWNMCSIRATPEHHSKTFHNTIKGEKAKILGIPASRLGSIGGLTCLEATPNLHTTLLQVSP